MYELSQKKYRLGNKIITYGFVDVAFAARHHQAPYYSVTTWDVTDESGGAVDLSKYHDSLNETLRKIARSQKWHLTAWPGRPMHYIATALYWAEKCCGVSEWKAESYESDPLKALLHAAVVDTVEEKRELLAILARHSVPKLEIVMKLKRTRQAAQAPLHEELTAWLEARQERLTQDFQQDMIDLGVAKWSES